MDNSKSRRAERAYQRLHAIEASAEFQGILERELPFRTAALAVVDLRGRHELTQQALAERVGTTQSVIARLESGKRPVELTLLKRIADALGEPLQVSFGSEALGVTGAEEDPKLVSQGVASDQNSASATGDLLLDEFNRANTARDWPAARRAAGQIEADPSTPRRQVALALNAYNLGCHPDAVQWSERALAGELPPTSRDTALLVLGRSLVHLRHARKALRVFGDIAGDSPLGWLVPAARADAYVELENDRRALREAGVALAMAPDVPEARFHAARAAWHADRVWEALDHVSVFRAGSPDNLDGLLLHGGILGYLGTKNADQGALESALELFRRALPNGGCEALRLYGMTAAHLGRWAEAFRYARRLLRHRGDHQPEPCVHGQDGKEHRHYVDEYILPGTFAALADRDPEEIERAANDAERQFGPSRLLASQRARARALRGDLSGTLASLKTSEAEVPTLPAEDQITVAAALYTRHDFAGAFNVMRRVESSLSRPQGLLRLAECAIAAGELGEARRALAELGHGEDVGAEVARVASSLMHAQAANARMAPERLTDPRWYPLTGEDETAKPRQSLWEGTHHRTTPMLDLLPRHRLVN